MRPVSGDLVVTTKRFDWGALVPVSGPALKISTISGSYGSRPGPGVVVEQADAEAAAAHVQLHVASGEVLLLDLAAGQVDIEVLADAAHAHLRRESVAPM